MSKKKNGNGSPERLEPETDRLLQIFGLAAHTKGALLENWVGTTPGTLDVFEKKQFDKIRQYPSLRVRGMNEEEVKMHVVSKIFDLADVEIEGRMNLYFERPLSDELKGHKLSVVADCMIAAPLGFSTPEAPYFFLQEFKRAKSEGYDPEGQMLAAMLIAQHQNPGNAPVYGAWLQGNIWYFAVLHGCDYYVSRAFDALMEEDLMRIVFILRQLKPLILGL